MTADTDSSTNGAAEGAEPMIVEHTFYLFDDTDEHTRTLCGICAFGPEDHIGREAWIARERLRDAAPALYEATMALVAVLDHDCGCDGDCDEAMEIWNQAERLARAALRAATTDGARP